MSPGPKQAIAMIKFIANELKSLAPDMDAAAVLALQDQDVFLAGLVDEVKDQLKEMGEGRPTFEEVVEITQQCYVAAGLTLNRNKHERLRQVLLNGLGIENRQQDEHTLLMRAVSDFDCGHIEVLNKFLSRSQALGPPVVLLASPLVVGQTLELEARGFLSRAYEGVGTSFGLYALEERRGQKPRMLLGISNLGRRLLTHLAS